MDRVPIYILAGGRSRRFGSDKARAVVGGSTLLERVAETLRPVVDTLCVVADVAGKYEDLGLRTIADRVPGRGPLSGLHAALCDLEDRAAHATDAQPWLLLISCDFVVLRLSWIERLVEARRSDFHAVAFSGEHWEPFPGLYHRELRTDVERRLGMLSLAPSEPAQMGADGGRLSSTVHDADTSLCGLLNAVRAVRVPLPRDWLPLAHVNTSRDLELALCPVCPSMLDARRSGC